VAVRTEYHIPKRRSFMRAFRVLLCGVGALLCLPLTAAVAQDGPATGAVVWARIPGSTLGGLFGSSAGSIGTPQLVVGYQAPTFSIGLALGINRFKEKDTDTSPTGGTSEFTGTVWQAGPSALYNFAQSADGMTRSNVSGELTFGKISTSDKSTPTGGSSTETKMSGSVMGFRLGVGGDHFLGQHFGLGAEVGLEGTFVSGFGVDGATSSEDLSGVGAYGVLRTTFAF